MARDELYSTSFLKGGKEMDPQTRTERDSLGEHIVPAQAYYGVQTARARDNFPISGLHAHPELIRATALIKQAAAEAHLALGELDADRARAIIQAASEIAAGQWHDQFVVDVFQAGAGTSHNMNANEVIANRAIEILGGQRGDYSKVHPNDHVNMGQSTNDVFPTAMRLACLPMVGKLTASLLGLQVALARKGQEFDRLLKSGRTHLQDAVPIRLGQEFTAYALSIAKCVQRIESASKGLFELGLGATAVGTGLNTSQAYRKEVIARLRELTGLDLQPAQNYIELTQNTDAFLELSGALRLLVADLIRIANDLRLLSSGPMTGLAEIELPPMQPGSSIMPGKVNPVIAEMMNMVCFQVMGNDLTISLACQAGQLELNVMMPVMAFALLFSLEILTNAIKVLKNRCVEGITADERRCTEYLHHSLGLATALNPYLGYAKAAEVARQALHERRSIREVVLERGLLTAQQLDEILNPERMTEPPEKRGDR